MPLIKPELFGLGFPSPLGFYQVGGRTGPRAATVQGAEFKSLTVYFKLAEHGYFFPLFRFGFHQL